MSKSKVPAHRFASGCDTPSWWLREHSIPISRLPGLHRAVFNLVRGDGADGYDSISELWYDSQPTLPDTAPEETARLEA